MDSYIPLRLSTTVYRCASAASATGHGTEGAGRRGGGGARRRRHTATEAATLGRGAQDPRPLRRRRHGEHDAAAGRCHRGVHSITVLSV